MGFKAVEAAYPVTVGSPGGKAVLMALAWHACDSCGLTWVGVEALARDTEMGATTIRKALASLAGLDLARVARFPKGGRGLTTEYVILPQRTDLAPAPCERCVSVMKKPPRAGAFRVIPPGNPSPPDAFAGLTGAKATGMGAIKPPPGGDHQSENNHQSGAGAPRGVEPSLSVGQAFDHPADDPAARQAAEDALRAVREMTAPLIRPRP